MDFKAEFARLDSCIDESEWGEIMRNFEENATLEINENYPEIDDDEVVKEIARVVTDGENESDTELDDNWLNWDRVEEDTYEMQEDIKEEAPAEVGGDESEAFYAIKCFLKDIGCQSFHMSRPFYERIEQEKQYVMNLLPGKEMYLIEFRYGFGSEQKMKSIDEICHMMNISKAEYDVLFEQAIARLRDARIRDHFMKGAPWNPKVIKHPELAYWNAYREDLNGKFTVALTERLLGMGYETFGEMTDLYEAPIIQSKLDAYMDADLLDEYDMYMESNELNLECCLAGADIWIDLDIPIMC